MRLVLKGKFLGVSREMLWKKDPKMQIKAKERSELTMGDTRDSGQKDCVSGEKNDECSSVTENTNKPDVLKLCLSAEGTNTSSSFMGLNLLWAKFRLLKGRHRGSTCSIQTSPRQAPSSCRGTHK